MVPLGERGPAFRPEQDYFSVSLVAIHLPGGGFGTQKFAPVVWSSVKHVAMDGEHTLVGVFPTVQTSRPEFARNDRVEVFDLQLTPRIIAREELTVEFTLGKMKEKDYVAGALKVVSELAASPAATFISQMVPVIAVGKAVVEGVVQTVDRLSANLNELLDNDKLQSLGRFVGTLRAPLPSGFIAFMDASEGETVRFDPARNALVNAAGPIKSAYAVLRLQCDPTRPDWMLLPDLNQAWARIREAALDGGDIKKAIEFFRITAVTSPDLTRADAMRLVDAAQQKFGPVLQGAESFVSDPGGMEESLRFFLDQNGGQESLSLTTAGRAAAAMAIPPAFSRALDMVLQHEGGYVDHPNDPGGATNKGVTQKVYNAYRTKKGQPKRSVKEIADDELQDLYFNGYWRPAMCGEMPNEALATFMLDAAVNHGPSQAIKLLQQAAQVPDKDCDGCWGPNTRGRVMIAASNAQALIEACLLARERFYRRIVQLNPKLAAFLRGWMNRLTALRAHLQPMLARAQPGGDTETALYEDDSTRVPLRIADPDFSKWEMQVESNAIAAQ